MDEGARTLRHACRSLGEFAESLAEGESTDGMSPADADWVSSSHHRHRTARRRLWAWAGWNTQLTLGNILDHVQAIQRTLVGEPVAIWSLVSLSRVVQEGTIRMCHLYEDGLSPEQRAVRMAAAWLNGARQHQTAAKDVGPEAVPEADEIWEYAERTVQRAGMSIGLDGKGRPNSAVLGSVKAPFAVNLTGIAGKRPAHLPAWYRISSAASHSTVWMVAQASSFDEGDQPVMRADPEIVTAAVLAVLGAFEDFVQTLGAYHGKDPQPALLTIRRRTVAVFERQRRWRRQAEEDARLLLGHDGA
ncbi:MULTISPECIES: hypothetical protein [unclassified Streptomyces]|uniref:hypothetical protein n=1 Tax=unclassified Streptomyces TaxID=2593676 RepID=UPI002E12431B|nr:hypothetical protein OG243_00025 [Streptomyces sp. NBC_01318]WSJ55943.1 hypothetical protein OG243_44515 [Streptomyces sp. NBC_01318]